MDMDNDVAFMLVMTIITYGIGVGAGYLMWGLDYAGEINISNSTAHDICLHLTNNSAVQASADDGRLVCAEPSYDHTQNIIIKSNAEDGK